MAIRVVCEKCGGETVVKEHIPVKIQCQQCGSDNVRLFTTAEAVLIKCTVCGDEYAVSSGAVVKAYHDKQNCKGTILQLSRTSSAAVSWPKPFDLKTLQKGSDTLPSVRIVIPYYEGNPLVARAALTWVRPEVVFALTEPHVVPPGFGVCKQIFTPLNAKEELGASKPKPFLNDLLKRLMEVYPNEEYYGFFNADIILPPGTVPYDLVPHGDKLIALHHRREVTGKVSGVIVSELVAGGSKVAGCDGFVGKREVIKKIIEDFPNLVVGAPWWDDGLCVWLWKEVGRDKVDMRYGEVWHFEHKLQWSPEDPESLYNKEQLGDEINKERLSVKWVEVYRQETRERQDKPKIAIIQPGRLGDIVICLPIAKYYADKGYEVHWPVCRQFIGLFDRVDYVVPHDLGANLSNGYLVSRQLIDKLNVTTILDLAVGFQHCPYNDEWLEGELSFDEWKFQAAGVDFEKYRSKLSIRRIRERELALAEAIGLKPEVESYIVTHSRSSFASYDFTPHIKSQGRRVVEVHPVEGFTLFDWCWVLEEADEVWAVDSCMANLVDGLIVGRKRRRKRQPKLFFRPWYEVYDERNLKLRTPKLRASWKILERQEEEQV